MYRVYDRRTDETLYEANNNIDCALWMGENVNIDSDDFDHIWLERISELPIQ